MRSLCAGNNEGGEVNEAPFTGSSNSGGDILTIDHLVGNADDELTVGVTGDVNALVIKDIYSGLKHCYPVATKSADDSDMAIRHLLAAAKWDLYIQTTPESLKKLATS